MLKIFNEMWKSSKLSWKKKYVYKPRVKESELLRIHHHLDSYYVICNTACMQTQAITVRLDETSTNLLNSAIRTTKQNKSIIVREALKKYLQAPTPDKSGAEFLTSMAKTAQQNNLSAPSDIVENLDSYLYQS